MLSALTRRPLLRLGSISRHYASTAPAVIGSQIKDGSIATVFASLSDTDAEPFPARFADLKKQLWKDELVESWRQVLADVSEEIEVIAQKQQAAIPEIVFRDLEKGVSADKIAEIKKAGSVVVRGGVSKADALAWKQSIIDYTAANKSLVKGFPPDNIQFFELFNSVAQITARTHPALIRTQEFLLSLWHASSPTTPASLTTPISYFDRLRIKHPDPDDRVALGLGPHIDGGSIEHWEHPGFRAVFGEILEGGDNWRLHDPYDVTPRLGARRDLYQIPNQCTVFRAWQGWTSISSTGPGEGTLQLLPTLSLATAYMLLRPFFRPTRFISSADNRNVPSLEADDWVPDLGSPDFPGTRIGKTQEMNVDTHPHLQLARSMISVPKVEPGDQVYWHCDGVHAVESHHRGKGDSSVLYIPAMPLTLYNAHYLASQRNAFLHGYPSPDFPGGEGESRFTGRATPEDIKTVAGRRLLGLAPFEIPVNATEGERKVIEEANKILF
ncbi:DUF1479-domain-containing protein [Neolentinus lepideus HHB14362 ss-1]|uniref:DUF1479-domain-containing protein n=1 Tax=Neolentinus lepideus HHB14362 ss-1 TaxID=1314782 RepID=A0A165TSM9_9AGAM|nr:DUF1479-domain-containing protein [Neolentinus lepideus HHB14362 ss-1]